MCWVVAVTHNRSRLRGFVLSKRKSVILTFPPLLVPCYHELYPSLPTLAAILRKRGWKAIQLDLNSEFMDWFVQSRKYHALVNSWRKSLNRYESRSSIGRSDLMEYFKGKRMLTLNRLLVKNNYGSRYCVERLVRDAFKEIAEGGGPRTASELRSAVCSTDEVWRLMREFYRYYFEKLRVDKPCFVGISLVMGPQLVPGLQLARWMKRHLWPDVPIFCGGALSTLLKDDVCEFILKCGVTGIVKWEGEEAVVEIAKELSKKRPNYKAVPNLFYSHRKKIISSDAIPTVHMGSYPVPYYEKDMVVQYQPSWLTVIAGRKCYWGKCSYCDFQKLYNRHQMKDPKKVAAEMGELMRDHGQKTIYLSCDSITPEYVVC